MKAHVETWLIFGFGAIAAGFILYGYMHEAGVL